MIFDLVVLFIALGVLYIERLYGWYEEAREYVTRCFVQRVARVWGWIVIRDLCPCALALRLTADTNVGTFQRASIVCVWVDRRVDSLEYRYGY